MVVWFSWRDRAPEPGEDNWWAINTGLFDRAGNPKPAWQAFARVSGGRAGLGAPAPTGGGPSTPPSAPPPGGGGGGGGGCSLIIFC